MRIPSAATLAVALLTAASAPGCMTSDDQLEEEDALSEDGKSDGFFQPTDHGTLDLLAGGEFAKITASAKFHQWSFTLTDRAAITLDTRMGTAFGPQVDTVLYLYKEGRAGYLAKNDEAGPGWKYSQLERSLGAGTYRVIVKGKLASTRGKISISVDCEGRGCHAADWLEAMKTTYDTDGLDGFDPAAFDDLPTKAQEAVTEREADFFDEHTVEVRSFDADGAKAFVVEITDEARLGVQLFAPDGSLAASGSATESSGLDWD